MSKQIKIGPGTYIPGVLRDYGTIVSTKEGNIYIELPFWFQMVGEEIILHIDIPEDLSQFITKARLGGDNPQPIKPKL